MTAITRAFEATVDDVKAGERSVVARIGGRDIDRHNTVIEPRGIALESYRKNPVVLWEHGRDPARGMLPVGRNQWIKSDGDRLIAKTVFRDDPYSQELFRAYQDGDLRGWSVNVLSHEASPPTNEEIRGNQAMSRCEMVYRRTELAEYSAVAIPSHRDALTVLASRGIWIPDEARTMTDSTGGLEGGGEMAAGEEDRGYGMCPECGKPGVEAGRCAMGHTWKPKDRTTPGATPVVSKSAPPGPWIETDGQTWTIFASPGRAVAMYEDARVAEESLQLMRAARPGQSSGYERMLARFLAEQQASLEQKVEDMIARLNLELFGRV